MLFTLIVHGNVFEGGIPRFIGNFTLLQTLSFGNCRLGGGIPDVFQQLNWLTNIAMSGNNLVGNIPPSLYNLSLLEQLFLDNNRLTGILPMNLVSVQPRLTVLSLPDNQFTGPIPSSILGSPQLAVLDVAKNNFSGKLIITPRNSCNFVIMLLSSNSFGSGDDDELAFIDDLSICRKLEMLDLGLNQLRGSVPQSLGNLSNSLHFLSLASNDVFGGLPSSIGNLSGLTLLDMSSNQLTGTLPVTIGNLGRSLCKLDIRNNFFSGNIPVSFGNLSFILELDLSFNELTGTIPLSLENCQRLLRLNLERNSLTGFVPRELFQLTSLSISLNLGSNQLSGQIPTNVGNLQHITEIILANNRFSGELPSGLGSCINLQNLNLSHNFFSGSLPTSLGSLRGLENLDVSSNNFSGEIPSYLEEILLESLNISFNDFDGEVPRTGVFANASAVSIIGNSRLCGSVPEFRLPKCKKAKSDKRLSLSVMLVICIVSVLIFLAALVLFFLYFFRRKRMVEEDRPECVSRETLVQVSYEMLYNATDGFATKNIIGEGSFSSVYKACPDADGVIVAIKVLNLQRQGGSKSFISECAALRNIRHRNLTKVITCCSGVDFQGKEFKAIVYEFMPNGSLDRWLHNVDEFPQLTLLQRVCIALDVANAIDYLHHHAGKTIIHCDLKPSNILLDDYLVAHVGDFGLSKILQSEYPNRHHSSSAGVRGTIGYAAPEYGIGSKVSRSGDMYSFGILLLEMIIGKKPTDAMFGEGLSLHNYAKTAMGDGGLGIVDPALLNDDGRLAPRTNKEGTKETMSYMNNEICLRLLLEIGVSCSMESPNLRMDAAYVVQQLQLIKDAISRNTT